MVQTESENKQVYQQSEEEAMTLKKDASININFNHINKDFKSSKSREEAKVEVKVDLWKESIIEDLKSSRISDPE
jgi:hypothetical protein